MPTTHELQRRRFALMAAEHVQRIGRRIRERREELGMTQRELAEGIPGKTDGNQVSKWERGAHRVGDDTLERIAEILKVPLAHFYADEPDKAETPDPFATEGQDLGARLDEINEKLEALLVYASALQVLLPPQEERRGGRRRQAG